LLLLAACHVPTTCGKCTVDTHPATTSIGSTGTTGRTGATAETGADTGWTTTGALLVTSVGSWQQCPPTTLGSSIAAPSLSITEVTRDHVVVARTGPIRGCVLPTGLDAAVSGSTVTLHWKTGICDTLLCGIGSATIEGLSPGDYTLTEQAPGATLTADITIPR